MKITIAYTADEEREAVLIQQLVGSVLDGIQIRKGQPKPPFRHLYLTAKKHCSKGTSVV